jgi:hypothetical protein
MFVMLVLYFKGRLHGRLEGYGFFFFCQALMSGTCIFEGCDLSDNLTRRRYLVPFNASLPGLMPIPGVAAWMNPQS